MSIGVFFSKIIIPLTFQLLSILHQVVWFALFIFWLIVLGRTWPPERGQCIAMCLCCCVKSNNIDQHSEKQSKRLITYKLFLLFVLSALVTSLLFVCRSRIDLSQTEKIIAICVVCLAGMWDCDEANVWTRFLVGLFEILLIMPPYLFLKWIKIQIFVINILMCKCIFFLCTFSK